MHQCKRDSGTLRTSEDTPVVSSKFGQNKALDSDAVAERLKVRLWLPCYWRCEGKGQLSK